MIFNVDDLLKKDIQKKVEKNNKVIQVVWIVEKIVLALTMLFTVCFPIYCVVTNSFVATVSKTGEKSYEIIVLLTAIVCGMGLTAWLLIFVFRKRLISAYAGGRIDEMIEINGNMLFYTFRIKYQTSEGKKNLVILNLDKIDKLSYDEKLRKIEITGEMFEKTISISKKMQNVEAKDMSMCELQIYDYFIPSLYEQIKKYNS